VADTGIPNDIKSTVRGASPGKSLNTTLKQHAIGDWLRLVIFFVCECYGHDGSGKSGHMEEGLCSRSC